MIFVYVVRLHRVCISCFVCREWRSTTVLVGARGARLSINQFPYVHARCSRRVSTKEKSLLFLSVRPWKKQWNQMNRARKISEQTCYDAAHIFHIYIYYGKFLVRPSKYIFKQYTGEQHSNSYRRCLIEAKYIRRGPVFPRGPPTTQTSTIYSRPIGNNDRSASETCFHTWYNMSVYMIPWCMIRHACQDIRVLRVGVERTFGRKLLAWALFLTPKL